MTIDQILAQLRSERDRIDQVITVLSGRGRPRSSGKSNGRRRGGRRRMSAAGRKRLSQLMRQRWAARKKAGKSSL